MDRNDRRRLRKIHRWLADEFPTQWPVGVRVVQKMPAGYEDCSGAYFPQDDHHPATIYLWADLSRREAIDTLLHEWAHATYDPEARGAWRHHGGHTIHGFYPEYGRIERAYHDALSGPLKVRGCR